MRIKLDVSGIKWLSKWIFLARSFTRMKFYLVRCLFADKFYFNIHHRLHWLNQVSYNIARLPHKEIPIKKFCLLNDRAFTRKRRSKGWLFVTTSLTNHSEVSPYLLIFLRYIVDTLFAPSILTFFTINV